MCFPVSAVLDVLCTITYLLLGVLGLLCGRMTGIGKMQLSLMVVFVDLLDGSGNPSF